MSHKETAIFTKIQDVLKNADCHPQPASDQGLKCLAEFSERYRIATTEEEFLVAAKRAWKNRTPQ